MSSDNRSPNALQRLFRRGNSPIGSVSTSLLSYISVGMWLTFAAVAAIVASAWGQLSNAFMTNIPLNGLIIAILLTGLGRAVWSNLRCWSTARYLDAIERVVKSPETPTQEDVKRFQKGLVRGASVLNTKQMSDLLENLPQYGHLNISDNDARMVKSKLGFRVSMMRNNNGFLAGILVMLGLLGTFWGLIATIDAVGKAMNGMSSIGGADSTDMSSFLTSIAAPLEGMGLAFSSSLFGLAGSLLIGFFNFLCGGVHNQFIESVSRWIDDRIPRPDANMRKGQKNPKVAGSDELKAWLVGFVQTSIETNKQIAQLVEVVRDATATSLASARNTRNMLSGQRVMEEELKEIRRAHARGLSVVRKEINDRSFELAAKLRRFKDEAEPTPAKADDRTEIEPPLVQRVVDAEPATGSHETRDQISTLVENLQALLEQEDLFAQMRNSAAEADIDLDGLPPSLKRDETGDQAPNPDER